MESSTGTSRTLRQGSERMMVGVFLYWGDLGGQYSLLYAVPEEDRQGQS